MIHSVGPVHGRGTRAELESCYRESLRVAEGLGARSVAFPAISAGVYGWPLDDAVNAAVTTVALATAAGSGSIEEVVFVPFGAAAETAYRRELAALDPAPSV